MSLKVKAFLAKYAKGILAAIAAAVSAYVAGADVLQIVLSALVGGGVVTRVPNKA